MRAYSGLVLAFLALVAYGTSAAWDTVMCEATRDVWLSCMGEEADFNMGAAPKIKLKGWQEFGIADFDVSALKGKVVSDAYVWIKPAGGHKLGLNAGSDLAWLTVSTVGSDWVEGKSASYGRDETGNGATFNESSYKKRNWGWPGAKCWDVILGNGNTIRYDGRLQDAGGGWLKLRIPPKLVHALIAGASYGLVLMDGSIHIAANQFIYSREGRAGPRIEAVVEGPDGTPPGAPIDVRVEPAPNRAAPDKGAATVTLKVPAGAFAYRAKLNGIPVERWQLPFAGPEGSVQSFALLDLNPDSDLLLEIAAVDAAGNESPCVAARGRSSPRLTVPNLPACGFLSRPGDPSPLGPDAKVWALPEISKVDPVSGELLHEKAEGDFRKANAVWDGSTGTVRLAAAKGEIVSFQLVVEGKAEACRIEISPPRKGETEIPARSMRLWRNWYVQRQSEYAFPLSGTFDCPARDNGVEGQKLQAITVDCHVPQHIAPGEYEGRLSVSSGDRKAVISLKVKVYDVAIPDDIHFNPELNCYSGPGRAGSEKFRESFRLAHYHRCTINRVPYSQGGKVHDDWAPKTDGRGRVTDWSAFDRDLGPLFDGSLFADSPRRGVPVPTAYLPLFEGWPLNFRDHYRPGDGVPASAKTKEDRLRHDTLARPIEEAFDDTFKEAFVACARDFAAHFREKGWNRTIFQCYLNNKPNYGYTMWTLDEPNVWVDWAALNFFAGLLKRGIEDADVYSPRWHEDLFARGLAGLRRDRPTIVFRGDISRPMWQGSCSDGLMNMIYIGGVQFSVPRLAENLKLRAPAILYSYGACNDPSRSNWETAAWCLKAYAAGSDGVLPWQSLGGPDALRKLNQEALIVDGSPAFGPAIASFRVHALRRGAQDCELLRLLQLKMGWSRSHIAMLISQKVPLYASFKQKFEDDAAAVSFGTLTSRGFCELKEGVLRLLSDGSGR